MSIIPRPFTLNPQLFNPALYSRLLTLWFSNLPLSSPNPTPEHIARWFGLGAAPEAKAAFDSECTSTAHPALLSIAADKYPLPPFKDAESDQQHYAKIAEPFLGQISRSATATTELANEEAALGLMLLLDQMPRNVFRSQQDLIYRHYDRISRAVAYAIYSKGLDQSPRFAGSPPWQSWFYLPLEHSEALSDHRLLDQKMEGMRQRMEQKVIDDPTAMGYISQMMGYERKHRVILDRFGRYPHRNKVLGREHTGEEEIYLREGGDTFGT
ncbi:MAG: hypothetical protein Q9170_008338 [Blastenia crenularia]